MGLLIINGSIFLVGVIGSLVLLGAIGLEPILFALVAASLFNFIIGATNKKSNLDSRFRIWLFGRER